MVLHYFVYKATGGSNVVMFPHVLWSINAASQKCKSPLLRDLMQLHITEPGSAHDNICMLFFLLGLEDSVCFPPEKN